MTQENFPQPEYSRPQLEPVQVDGSFDKDGTAIQEAVRYVNEFAPTWILEPADVLIIQPDDQEELIGNLGTLLSSRQDGEQLQRNLQGNLINIKVKQAQPEHHGFCKLDIKAGYDMNDLRIPGDKLTKAEYEMLRANSWSNCEVIEDLSQPNVMVTGLLQATGAEIVRQEDFADGGIDRLYKGMLDSQPVYFEELILPIYDGYIQSSEGKKFLTKTFSVVSELTARNHLNNLSAKDVEVLANIGVGVPNFYSPEYNPSTYPNRSRMIEMVQLYAGMNPETETGTNVNDEVANASRQEFDRAQTLTKKLAAGFLKVIGWTN